MIYVATLGRERRSPERVARSGLPPAPGVDGGQRRSVAEIKRCLIVDDHLIFAQLLARMLTAQLPLKVVGITTDVATSLDLLESAQLELLILDLELPDGSGLEVAQRFVALNPEGLLIIVSAHSREFVPSDQLRSSVAAVLDKTTAFEHLSAAIRSLNAIDSPGLDTRNVLAEIDVLLTTREIEVLDQLGRGLSTKQIAHSLHLSEMTIATHRKRIGSKLGIKGSELVYWATLHRQRLAYPL